MESLKFVKAGLNGKGKIITCGRSSFRRAPSGEENPLVASRLGKVIWCLSPSPQPPGLAFVSSFEGDRMSSAFDAVGRVKSRHRINEAIRPTHEEWQEYSSRTANCCSISPATGSIRPCFEDTIGIDQRNSHCRQETALKSQPTCPLRKPESSAKSLAQRVTILSAKCVAFASSLNITGLKLPLLRNQERKHMFKNLKRKKSLPSIPSVFKVHFYFFLSLEAGDSLDFIKRLKTRPFI